MLEGREVVEGEVIVRYRAQSGRIGRERAELEADSDASEAIGRRGARRLRSTRLTTRQMLEALRANPDVELVEPNFIVRASALPNDPSMSSLWGLHNTGETVDGQAGTPGADIGAAAAWDVTTGSRATVIAVLDTGIDVNHPDLAANLFTAPRPFSVTLGSTTVTCPAGSHGFNAIDNSCVVFNDENGHGTHVAGIIGAVGNNGVGVTGVNWTANVMAIKILGADGTGATSDAIKGIEFAIKAKAALGADANVRVLNASWGGAEFSLALQEEIEAANSADMLFVVSAGSVGSNNDSTPHYPASYPSSNVVSVAAVDNRGALLSFSNYGATSVHLAAPGASTLSTLPNNSYGVLSGTSMSAPHVAGAAALILSVCPSTTATLKSRLLASVDPDPSLSGKTISGGRLNVNNAVRDCPRIAITVNGSASSITAAPGSTVTVTVANSPGAPTDWAGLFAVGAGDGQSLEWKYLNGLTTLPAVGLSSATLPFTAPSLPGSYEVRLYGKGFVKLATSPAITVAAGSPPSSATLTTSTSTVSPGGLINVTLANGPANTTDWAGLFAVGAGDGQSLEWKYLNGLTTLPAVGLSSATLPFTAPSLPGSYEVRLYGKGFVKLATSPAITVAAGSPPSSATLTTSTSTVSPGGLINVTLANGPANTTDWAGLFAVGAGDGQSLEWKYLNGLTTLPAVGLSSATLPFTAPSLPGSYEVRLYGKGFVKLATSPAITVAAGSPPSSATLTTSTSTVSPGGLINVTLANGPANTTDWAGLFAVGAGDGQSLEWKYLNGLTTLPAVGLSSATLSFTAPSLPGSYEVRLYGKGFVKLATSPAITVAAGSPPSSATLTTSTSTVSPGGLINVTLANGPANTTDWAGLFAVGAGDGQSLEWKYLNGLTTLPAVGLSSATLPFTAPSLPGSYEIRLYAKGYVKLATSGTFSVVP